jgi:NAD(P)-dependent dehydrogenase (short-subunit alcohol dehydrogenase family)
MTEFTNKLIAITGGNSGIGKSIVKKFHEEGTKIAILGRDKNKLERTKELFDCEIAFAGDVSKISDLDSFYNNIYTNLGKIDILVANAGIASRCNLDEIDEQTFDEMVNINFKGVYFTVQRAIPFLNQNASIVLISSMAAHGAWPSHSLYSSTKAAVSMLAKNFAADLIDKGIRVNAISPGYTATDMYDPNFVNSYKKRIPSGEFTKPEEIAEAVAFLASSKANSIVGIDLVIDGGFTTIIKE